MVEVRNVDEAVMPIRTALEADGYKLDVKTNGESLLMHITAGPEACEDCLVPPAVMRPMITQALEDVGVSDIEWELFYPADY